MLLRKLWACRSWTTTCMCVRVCVFFPCLGSTAAFHDENGAVVCMLPRIVQKKCLLTLQTVHHSMALTSCYVAEDVCFPRHFLHELRDTPFCFVLHHVAKQKKVTLLNAACIATSTTYIQSRGRLQTLCTSSLCCSENFLLSSKSPL